MLTQVCATGARVLFNGAAEIALGMSQQALILSGDRCSNGPHLYYPAPKGPGGYGQSEDQVTYNMMNDAIGGHSMLKTAENVAKKYQITKEEQDAVTLRRYEQYGDALKNDHAFQKRYMTLPFSVPKHNFKGEDGVLAGDEGVFETTADGLAKLKPTLPERHGHVRQPNPSGGRQCRPDRHHAGTRAGDERGQIRSVYASKALVRRASISNTCPRRRSTRRKRRSIIPAWR